MLENIPEGDYIKKTGETLLPVSSIDGLSVQRNAEFLLGEIPEDPLRFDAMDNSPRLGVRRRRRCQGSSPQTKKYGV